MKKLFLIGLLFVMTTILAQKGKIIKFPSNALRETRLLEIYVPESYKKDGDRVYPLTVILDSEMLFDIYVSNAKLYANSDKAPEQIIVGIYQNQTQPQERFKDCGFDRVSGMPIASGIQFYKFMGELLNHMEENYRISPFKTIVGNTLTANFINYFLIAENPVFQAYVNINPDYAKEMTSMFHDKIPTIEEKIYYYVISGDYNGKRKQTMVKSVDDLLKSSQNEAFEYRYDEPKYATKTSSIGQGIASSLAFIFDLYSAISIEEYNTKVSKLTPPEAIAYLEKKYVEIEYLFGTNMKIRQKDIFAIESIILDQEDGDYLEEFGKMINRLYPDSPVGDYYIGRYYETGQDYKHALKYYKNGFSKVPADDPNKAGYYQNIERILELRKGGKVEDTYEEEDIPEDENSKDTDKLEENESQENDKKNQ